MENQGMIRSRQGSFSFLYRIIDLGILALCFWLTALLFATPLSADYGMALLLGALGYLVMAESFGVYRSWRANSAIKMLMTASAAWLSACAGLLLIGFALKVSHDFSRLMISSWMLSSLAALLAWRLVFRELLFYMRRRGFNSRNVAIVGLNDSAIRLRSQLFNHPELGMRFQGFFDDRSHKRTQEQFPDEVLGGSIEDLLQRTRQGEFDVVFIALPLKAQKRIASILERCGDTTASVHIIPDFFTYNLMNAQMGSVGKVQTISVFETPLFGFNDVIKRTFDIVFSSLVLCAIALPMLAIALAVKLTSKGPVIFKQVRYGLDGREIRVWKFRSMTTMDNGDKVVQAKKGDARITPVGAFIRKTSLDELPQFINVLQGRMSVVGPRPHAVAHNEEYRKLIPYYMLRHKVKPGITGWAQINGFRGETDTLDKMEGRVDYDLHYIRNWSIWMDIKIVFLTVFKGFTGSNVH